MNDRRAFGTLGSLGAAVAGARLSPTPEQCAVLESTASTVFVAAGAGSGKTSVLVERYLRALLDDGIPTDDLPTVTFTRKAAGEMRMRIRRALLERGHRELAWALDDAPIGTIHHLCGRILRAHPVTAGIDPAYTVLEEDQAEILRAEALDQAWDEVVAAADDRRLEILARHERDLRRSVSSLYQKLRSRGSAEPRFLLDAEVDVAGTQAALARALDQCLAAVPEVAPNKTAEANLKKVQEAAERLAEMGAEWDAMAALRDWRLSLNCGRARPLFEPVNQALVEYYTALGRSYLTGLAQALDALLVGFHRHYEQRKREAGLLDFVDLEVRARALLERGVRPFGPAARLMVDEFQDTNELQCAIFDRLGAASVLTVGDAYQSIYAFRGADVGVFRARRKELDRPSRADVCAATLSCNFRSRPALLGVVNHLFAQPALFGPSFPRLEAGRSGDQPRRSGEDTRGRLDPACELWILGGEEDNPVGLSAAQVEAAFVAQRVRRLIAEEGWRPGHIAVLLRSFTHVREYEEALRAGGVAAYVVEGRGYYEREELHEVLAALHVLVNPHDEPALLTVLRSPFVGLSDDALYLIRLHADARGALTLWEGLQRGTPADLTSAETSRLALFLERLGRLRRRLGTPGLASLLADLVESFDYDLVLLQEQDGRRRYANLRKLMRLADEFESVEGPDVAAFVRYVSRKKDLAADKEGNAALLAEDADVVRVMTIHKAKGLEFPVVVVGGLGSSGSGGSTPLCFVGRGGELGLSLKGPGGDAFPRLTLGCAEALQAETAQVEAAEEVRLIYVAVTRAEERLVLTGSLSRGKAEGVLGQIMDALGMETPPVGAPSRPVAHLDLVVARGTLLVGAEGGMLPAVSAEDDTEHIAPEEPPYPEGFAPRAGIRRVSFSALAQYERCPRGYYLERVLGLPRELLVGAEQGDVPGVPGFLPERDWLSLAARAEELVDAAEQSDPAVTGRAVGHVVHRVLETVDLERPLTEAEAHAKVRRAAATLGLEISGGALARAVRLVRAFWRSPVASAVELRRARREVPFVFSHEGSLVHGYLDLLLERPDGWWVIDYKTNRLDGHPPEELAREYDLQAELYGLAGLRAGAPGARVGFLFLESPEVLVERIFTPADRPALERALSERLARLRSGRLWESAADCADCPLGGLCRALWG